MKEDKNTVEKRQKKGWKYSGEKAVEKDENTVEKRQYKKRKISKKGWKHSGEKAVKKDENTVKKGWVVEVNLGHGRVCN